VINPEHLLDQADRLIVSGASGRPRQVDYRRAISATYYALFHASLIATVELVVPIARRQSQNYKMIYRSIEHKKLRDLCGAITAKKLPPNVAPYLPTNGFSSDLVTFARSVCEMYEKRHLADYDPFYQVTRSDALLAVSTARAALNRFGNATADDLFCFGTLLLFQRR
jgi:uncharacterized protein (UPF0332 family)